MGGQETGKDTSFSAGVDSAGTYYVGINAQNSYYHDSGEYGLNVSTSAVTGNAETEDNGTMATADALNNGQEIKGQLATSSDYAAARGKRVASGDAHVNVRVQPVHVEVDHGDGVYTRLVPLNHLSTARHLCPQVHVVVFCSH